MRTLRRKRTQRPIIMRTVKKVPKILKLNVQRRQSVTATYLQCPKHRSEVKRRAISALAAGFEQGLVIRKFQINGRNKRFGRNVLETSQTVLKRTLHNAPVVCHSI